MPKTHVQLGEIYQTTITARDHTWHGDVPEDDGGENNAPTPEELLMGALGSCMAQTGKMYANRKGWQVDTITVDLDFERFRASDYDQYEGDAQFVHEIREAITIEGDLDDEQRQRILEIMGRCPVRRVLANPTFFVEMEIETEHEDS